MLLIILLALLAVVLLALGFEMFMVMGLPALFTKFSFYGQMPDLIIAQKMMGGVNVSTLLAIPFFIFAADLMSHGTIAERLLTLVKRRLGHYAGGAGYTTVASCMAFGAVCGSAPATVAGIGRLMYPELIRAGYRQKFSLGLVAASAESALLIPPSITLLVYGWLSGTSIAALFAAGLAVGIVLGLAFMLQVYIETRRSAIQPSPKASADERRQALAAASLALGLPVIILGGIYSGYFTATEAAAVAVIYALLLEMGIYRSFGFQQLLVIARHSVITVCAVFALLAMGSLLSHFITLSRLPVEMIAWLQTYQIGWIGFLLFVNVVLFIAAMFVDPNSIMLVLVPTFHPLAISLGIDPVHFGLVMCLSVTIGMITPPFGLDLFVTSTTLNKPVEAVVAGIWPFILVNILVLLLISYVPWISLVIPKLLW
jgi:C4-dicarboxylate transporter DctM subunit